jgi:hypothetical protein
LRVDFEQPQLLLQLAQLPALTHLALQYDRCCEGEPAVATASAWPLLPQLRELDVAHGVLPCQDEWEAILAGAAAATGLTRLTLDVRVMTDRSDEECSLESDGDVDLGWASRVEPCASLANLTCLQDLTLGAGDNYCKLNLLWGDALALTALTRLTRLVLAGAGDGVGTAVATALARSLHQLQSLDLGYCCLQLDGAEGFALLEAIGRLTQLTRLSLSGNHSEGLWFTEHGLMQLTGLSRLEQGACGDLCSGMDVPDDELTAFWAAVHAQRR